MAPKPDPNRESIKSDRSPIVFASVTALALGASGYLAVTNDLVPFTSAHQKLVVMSIDQGRRESATVFVPLDPFMVSLPRTDPVRQLRLEAQLEIVGDSRSKIEAIMPRLEDTMTGYLQAVDLTQIDDPETLLRTRLQLLRRLQVSAGDGLILDLLITQFLIS